MAEQPVVLTYAALRLMRLGSQHAAMVNYLKVMLDRSDWHGVSDAANDLREIECEMRTLRSIKGE